MKRAKRVEGREREEAKILSTVQYQSNNEKRIRDCLRTKQVKERTYRNREENIQKDGGSRVKNKKG